MLARMIGAKSKGKRQLLIVLCCIPCMALTEGTRLGSYVIAARIGAGGMGEVYRARDTRLGRDVAIKTLPYAVTHRSGTSGAPRA